MHDNLKTAAAYGAIERDGDVEATPLEGERAQHPTTFAATCSANPAPAVPKFMLGIILTVVCGLIVSAAVFYVYQRRRRRLRLGSSSFRQFVAEFNRGVEMT